MGALGSLGGSKIQGHVYNNSGAPIYNVQVAMCGTDYTCASPTVTRTDINGFYSIDWGSEGTFLVWANRDQASPFWEEKQNATIPGPGDTAIANFKLPGDLFTPVANLLLEFATVNVNEFQATLSWSVSSQVSVKVDSYRIPLGHTQTVQVGVTMSGSGRTTDDPTINAQVLQRGVVVHGAFWKSDPSHPINVYVSQTRSYYNIINTLADYLASPPPSATLVYCPKHNTCAISKNDASSFALRYELGVDGGVSIEGVGFSTKLTSTLIEGQIGVERTMTISLYNASSKTHAFEWYLEGGNILHVWQVS